MSDHRNSALGFWQATVDELSARNPAYRHQLSESVGNPEATGRSWRLDANPIVNRSPDALFAAEIALGLSDRMLGTGSVTPGGIADVQAIGVAGS